MASMIRMTVTVSESAKYTVSINRAGGGGVAGIGNQ